MRSLVLVLLSTYAVAMAQRIPISPASATEFATVSELLASQEPVKLSWGAYLAGNYELRAFSNDLLRLAISGDSRVRIAALESLVRLDVNIPEDVLAKMADNRLDEVLIFIARKPGQYSVLMEQLFSRQLEQRYWVALHSIAAAQPPVGFAAKLLREWTIRLHVEVHPPEKGSQIGASSSGGFGDGAPFGAPGYPPLAAYCIVEDPGRGDTLLATGPHPVGYRKQYSNSFSQQSIDQNHYRRDYLLHLALISRPDADRWSRQWASSDIVWNTPASYVEDSRKILRDVSDSVEALKRNLVERKLLTAAEAEVSNPAFEATVADRRAEKAAALPSVRWELRDPRQ